MKIAHVALWTRNIDAQLAFWQRYFSASYGEEYVSKNRPGFISRFVTLNSGAALEIMSLPELVSARHQEAVGWAHIAIGVGGEAQVDRLARQAEAEGILISAPRWTGDGFYEAVLADPDGNQIEIVG